MNYSRLGLAALGGLVASFAFGFLVFWLVPALINEGHKYPAVFRPKEVMFATKRPIAPCPRQNRRRYNHFLNRGGRDCTTCRLTRPGIDARDFTPLFASC